MSRNHRSKEKAELDAMYDRLNDYKEELHTQNQKKIKIGIRLLLIIPMVFLFLLFITNSNKIIFLVLWIASLFLIASYLIVVEYEDYKAQHSLNKISGDEDAEVESLIDLDDLGEKVENAKEHARERLEKIEDRIEDRIEERKEDTSEREEQGKS